MAASDYIVGNAPASASWAAPLLNFANIGELGNKYFEGTQQGRTRAMQTAFPKGTPMTTDPRTGQQVVDYKQIVDTGARTGGVDYLSGLLPFLQKQQVLNEDQPQGGAGAVSGSVSPPPSPTQSPATGGPGSHNPAGAGPGNLQVRPQSATAEGADTVRSRLTELFNGQEVGPLIPRFAGSLGVNPDAPLSPEQSQQLTMMAGKTKLALQAGRQGQRPGMTQGPSNDDTSINQQPGTVTPVDRSNNGAPVVPASGVSGSPAPQPVAAASGLSAAQAVVPASYRNDPLRYAEKQEEIANLARAKARRESIVGIPSKALEDTAAAADERAKRVRELLGKDAALTTEQQNARASGTASPLKFEQQKEQQKLDAASYEKKYDAIQKMDAEANVGRQRVALARQFTDNPDFYSGPLEHTVRLYKQFVAGIGGNPNAAMSQEAFEKNANNMLTDQIKALGGSGVGQVRVAEVNIMRKGIASLGITPATNRLILEESDRLHRDSQAVGQMARDYKRAHGGLDAGFEDQVAQYYKQHPLFTAKEMADPRLIAPPSFKSPEDAKKAGIPKGWPIKTPPSPQFSEGRIVPMQ